MQEYFEVRNQVDGENGCELCDKYLTGTLITVFVNSLRYIIRDYDSVIGISWNSYQRLQHSKIHFWSKKIHFYRVLKTAHG